jgi:thioredoxin-like negative regulator of GroEL
MTSAIGAMTVDARHAVIRAQHICARTGVQPIDLFNGVAGGKDVWARFLRALAPETDKTAAPRSQHDEAPRWTPEATDVLRAALAHAAKRRHHAVTGGHVALAAIDTESAAAVVEQSDEIKAALEHTLDELTAIVAPR